MAKTESNFAEVLAQVRQRFGAPDDLDEPRPLEQLILLILSRGVTSRRARSAMRRLQEDYVDWNEVRVSSVYEIRKALEALGPTGILNKAEQIRDLLTTAYTRFNKLQLDFLMGGPLDADRSRRLDRFVKYVLGTLCPAVESMGADEAKAAAKPAKASAKAAKAASPAKKSTKAPKVAKKSPTKSGTKAGPKAAKAKVAKVAKAKPSTSKPKTKSKAAKAPRKKTSSKASASGSSKKSSS